MDNLFTSYQIGNLNIKNRLVRSATAERMADDSGHPTDQLAAQYRLLAQGGVGLIITGHMWVHASGKAHAEMTSAASDDLIPSLAKLSTAVHSEGGKIVAQINHGGLQASAVADPIAPSAVQFPNMANSPRAMSSEEIQSTIQAFGVAAGRVKKAGFDGVQIHSAHGYLINEFLSPLSNLRIDEWGGSLENRMRFLDEVTRAVRAVVGPDYPVLVKLGVCDGIENGLSLDEGAQVAAHLQQMGMDAVEISGGFSGPGRINSAPGVNSIEKEAYFYPWAQKIRPLTRLPILLVGGFRSKSVMEKVLQSGDANFISLCRPLICEPDLPRKFQAGTQERSACISGNRCWPEKEGDVVRCKCKK